MGPGLVRLGGPGYRCVRGVFLVRVLGMCVWHSTVQYHTVPYRTVCMQYGQVVGYVWGTVQYSTVQYWHGA